MQGKKKALPLGQVLWGPLHRVFDLPTLRNTPGKRPNFPRDRQKSVSRNGALNHERCQR